MRGEASKSLIALKLSVFFVSDEGYSVFLFGYFLLNGQFTAIIATAGAYRVVDVPCTAVGADSQSGGYSLIMRSALECSRLGLSSFRMCHFSVIVLL